MKIGQLAGRLSKKVLELILTRTFICGVYVGLIGVSKLPLVKGVCVLDGQRITDGWMNGWITMFFRLTQG